MSENNLPAKVNETDHWMALIERVLTIPDLQISNLERILALRDRERHEAALEEFNRDLAACQAEIKQVARDKPNSAFNSKYASHKAMDDEQRPVAEKYGFAWTVTWLATENNIMVYEGTLSRGRIEKTFRLPVALTSLPNEGPRGGRMAQTPIQVTGSITTYMRKYLLMMAFNIVPADNVDDDDGESQRFRPKFWDRSPPPRQPQPQHTQQRPNGGDVWMKETIKLVSEPTGIDDKAHALRERLVPWSDNVEALERFSDNLLWKAYVAEQFPPDSEILTEVVVDLIQQARGTAA